ncbi:MAG: hypothetical protein V7641_5426, partial [Blastocatellia bacterium]
CTFTCTITTYYAYDFSTPYFKRNLIQRPESL